MIKSHYAKNLKLVRRFGEEKINSEKFKEFLGNRGDYFNLIDTWIAALVHWKKDSIIELIKDRLIYSFRKKKSKQRKKEVQDFIGKEKIVFFPVSETHVSLFEPIISKLGKENVGILRYDYAINGLKKGLKKLDLPYVNFEKYLDQKTLEKINKIKNRQINILSYAHKIIRRNKEYKKLGPALTYYFGPRKRFYEIIEFIEGIKNFLEKEKPSIVILADETIDIARAISYLCMKKKVPCIVMQHGIITQKSSEAENSFADKKTVFGQGVKNLLIKKGMPKEKIAVTGNPAYDNFVKKKFSEQEKKRFKNNLGIKKEKIILYASTWSLKAAEKRLRILFEIIKKIPNLKLIIKQHPSEYHQKKFEMFYQKLAKEYGIEVIISKGDMWKMLCISDIFVTDFSTTINEALILKKPVVLTNFEKMFGYENYPEYEGVVWHAYNFGDVLKAVKYILKNKYGKKQEIFRKKLIRLNIYKDDGKSAERIINIIKKIKT